MNSALRFRFANLGPYSVINTLAIHLREQNYSGGTPGLVPHSLGCGPIVNSIEAPF
jgi:hypothetical protein